MQNFSFPKPPMRQKHNNSGLIQTTGKKPYVPCLFENEMFYAIEKRIGVNNEEKAGTERWKL